MPPKTAAPATSALKNSAPAAVNNKSGKTVKAAEQQPTPSGPTIKSSITNAAPAPSGMSFLDAIRAGKKPAAVVPVAAAPAAAAPANVVEKTEEPVAEGPTAPAKAQKSKTPTPQPESAPEKPAVPTPAPEEVEHVPAVEPVAAPAVVAPAPPVIAATQPEAHFNWAADDDFNFNFQHAAASAQQYLVRYPARVTENRALNVVFKAPADAQVTASALETLSKERTAFEVEKRNTEERLQAHELELKNKEDDLVNRERSLRADTEKLNNDRIQFQQMAAAQQAAAARASPSQSPAVQPQQPQQSPQQPMRSFMNPAAANYSNQDWSNPQQDRWAGQDPLQGSYDMYYSYQQQPMRGAYPNYRQPMPRGNPNMGNAGRPMLHHMQQQQFNRMPATGGRPMDMNFSARPPQQQQQQPQQPPQQYSNSFTKQW